ncbi:hypothetical protein Acid345_3398 [Candidatus Koribacter versatilis Ellin345]|uniref:DUF4325 domain-containing protein n=1 Tax=Koribacter versatilis (strain Ellin345) TaxID=204669 RepID=Q1IL51_KORVE|nr:hypothetical protein [Candidatus Koribacter versatilis]ABF42399.1 hypothetical protein Acid345_3398 [Candidatus Koribacter versatilis Ellin345]
MAHQNVIDLIEYRLPETKTYSGRVRGEFVRRQMKLEQLDSQIEVVQIVIPADTFSVNMSFFLGLFGDSVRTLGKHGFFEHYSFLAPAPLLRILNRYADEALKEGMAIPESKTA